MTLINSTEQQLLDLQARVEALEATAALVRFPANNRTYYEHMILTHARQYATLKAFGSHVESDGNGREYISQPAKSDVPDEMNYHRDRILDAACSMLQDEVMHK